MPISKDMRFFYEIHSNRFNLYERCRDISIPEYDNCRDTLCLLAQVQYKGKIERALEAAFSHVEFDPVRDAFSLTELFSGKQFVGVYHPKRQRVSNLRQRISSKKQ